MPEFPPGDIHRYDTFEMVLTRRDPYEDLCNWISGLRSRRHTRDLLAQHHRLSGKALSAGTRAVCAHAERAVQLLEQARSGPPDVAFLPIYYALLNLAKICVVSSGHLNDLMSQRYHGATHSGGQKSSHDLMTDTISLKTKGAISLFYAALTGRRLTRKDTTMRMLYVYKYIRNIGYEYERIYGQSGAYQRIALAYEYDAQGKIRVRAAPMDHDGTPPKKHQLRVLASFREDPKAPGTYFTTSVLDRAGQGKHLLLARLRRALLVDEMDLNGRTHTLTPVSSSQLLLPEELPILLAFFQMSNVVRYQPEFLARLKDSRAWALLLVLREHASLSFLNLFWSYVIQSSLVVSR